MASLGASEDEHPAATTEASKTNIIRYVIFSSEYLEIFKKYVKLKSIEVLYY